MGIVWYKIQALQSFVQYIACGPRMVLRVAQAVYFTFPGEGVELVNWRWGNLQEDICRKISVIRTELLFGYFSFIKHSTKLIQILLYDL